MQDPDLAQLEAEGYLGRGAIGLPGSGGAVREWQEVRLASELLELSGERELDRFFGDMISAAARAADGVICPSAGHALRGILKGAARKALPIVGRPIQSIVPNAAAGIADQAGAWLGLELEGLSAEDGEFEVARQLVRFASAAAHELAVSAPGPSPDVSARAAVARAAADHAPGFLPPGPAGMQLRSHRPSGRWVRRADSIVLLGI
jgi:hypothetical protein